MESMLKSCAIIMEDFIIITSIDHNIIIDYVTYKWLVEGLIYTNSLVSSFQVFLFGRYCQKYLKISL